MTSHVNPTRNYEKEYYKSEGLAYFILSGVTLESSQKLWICLFFLLISFILFYQGFFGSRWLKDNLIDTFLTTFTGPFLLAVTIEIIQITSKLVTQQSNPIFVNGWIYIFVLYIAGLIIEKLYYFYRKPKSPTPHS